ncbi:MAG: ribonuclease HII [Chloroflexi bacterium]|nr:ribonuclease HII [Chloroflexota bacterium]HCU79769.1 ribonuclease HII [Chloroflexota bacterium]|tara:strand:- start:813 stop:1475 length:663 start_codon:yes stop_codon:yes gene_type:complete
MTAKFRQGNLPKRPHLRLENRYWNSGYKLVAGIDEAGRGAWAGPVVAAAVVLPVRPRFLRRKLKHVRDSKCLSPSIREKLSRLIFDVALLSGFGSSSPGEVDEHGIVNATRIAMFRAVTALSSQPDQLLIDAVDLNKELDIPQKAMYFGDSISLSVAAASILAKVYRDRLMVALSIEYPGYGFERHKGYGTNMHYDMLTQLRPTPVHRHTFKPIVSLSGV